MVGRDTSEPIRSGRLCKTCVQAVVSEPRISWIYPWGVSITRLCCAIQNMGLTRRPMISHLWGLYGDAFCARKFGRNLLFFNQPAPDVIKSLMEPVKRIGIINAFRNDAYVLELDSVSKDAEVVCEDIWKQFET